MFTKDEIQQAKDANLVELLQELRYPLKKITNKEYALLAHDSCRISPTKGFFWHSRDIGGNAIDFFMVMDGLSFTEAVALILSKSANFTTTCRKVSTGTEETEESIPEPFQLPLAHWNNERVIAYLTENRKIDKDIVMYCIKKKKIYESSQTHNVVFVGYDQYGQPRYACQRGTTEKRFAGDVKNSNKEFGFFLGDESSKTLHLFEAPIDLLSYMTLEKIQKRRCKDAYQSLSGVSLKAFSSYISRHPHIRTIYLRTDNDDKGRKTLNRIQTYIVEADLDVAIVPAFPNEKDYNDELIHYLKEKEGTAAFLLKK